MSLYQVLDWDTEVFDYGVAKIIPERLLAPVVSLEEGLIKTLDYHLKDQIVMPIGD